MSASDRNRRYWDLQEMRSLANREERAAIEHLRSLVDATRADLGLPARDWWYESLGLDRVARRLKHLADLEESGRIYRA